MDMMFAFYNIILITISLFFLSIGYSKRQSTCLDAFVCVHSKRSICGIVPDSREVRRFLDVCDMFEFNCEYKTIIFVVFMTTMASAHGPPQERDNENITMGRKMGAKWCGMAKVCNHDRVPICGASHAGDVIGFRDLCDMFDYNCIRRRNYRQTSCPEDKSILTVSRRPTNNYYEE